MKRCAGWGTLPMGTIRVVAIVEAHTVTGPAKNVIQFSRGAGAVEEGLPTAEVSIATFFRTGAGPGPAAPSNQFIEAVRAAAVDLDVIRERFRFDPRIITQLEEVLRRRSPNVVQTHGVKSHFLMRFSGLRRCYPWIAFHHGYTDEDLKMRLYDSLNRWSLPAADRVVTVCRPFAATLVRTGVARERIRVLPNSIAGLPRASDEEIRALRQKLGIGQGERVILSIGRLSREKAQVDLIVAAGHLTRLYPDLAFRLVLVGDGPERQTVARAAAGLGGRVLCVGHQANVRPYYSVADIFVLPSHSEGSPNVILEAMAEAVPIAATAVGGVPETLENEESALLVPAAAPEALAQAMARLLTDDELASRLVRNASATVAARFSPDAYRRSLMAVYAELNPSTDQGALRRR